MLARLWGVARKQQEGKKGLQPIGIDGGDNLLSIGDPQIAEQLDTYQRHRRPFSDRRRGRFRVIRIGDVIKSEERM